jgi:hypothetical protein
MPTDADIENMSLQDLCGYQQALMTDITSGTVTMDDAKPIIKRIEKRLKATKQKLRDEGIIQKRRKA